MVKLTDNEWAILEVLWADGPCELGGPRLRPGPHPPLAKKYRPHLPDPDGEQGLSRHRPDPGPAPLHGGHRPGAVCPPKPGVSSWIKFTAGPRESSIAAFLGESHITPGGTGHACASCWMTSEV